MSKVANDNPQAQDGVIRDDIILPFQLQESGLRGRVVRLGPLLDGILSSHDYPEAVSHLLADTIALTAALSSMLKYDGIFTLQTSSDGPVRTLVADMNSEGHIRGCATFDREAVEALTPSTSKGPYAGLTLAELTGKGYLAFTVDQGSHTDRYQGIVALEGDSLADSVSHYFRQSEQIRTGLSVASAKRDNHWRAGAIMVQFLPDAAAHNGEVVALHDKSDKEKEEDWNRTRILLQTCTDEEITNPNLHVHELLRRLFHEEGVVVYDAQTLAHVCRCSMEKVGAVLAGLPAEDIAYAMRDGFVEMTCEFCSRSYKIDLAQYLQ